MEKLGTLLEANDDFCLAISYNPGYQSVLKDLKQSTRQRFVALEFNYPCGTGAKIVNRESGVARAYRRETGQIRTNDAQPQRKRSGRRRQHAPAGACGQTHCSPSNPSRHARAPLPRRLPMMKRCWRP